jgi:hypothetical protein
MCAHLSTLFPILLPWQDHALCMLCYDYTDRSGPSASGEASSEIVAPLPAQTSIAPTLQREYQQFSCNRAHTNSEVWGGEKQLEDNLLSSVEFKEDETISGYRL